jgi:periplasmic protein CpxP/Spy
MKNSLRKVVMPALVALAVVSTSAWAQDKATTPPTTASKAADAASHAQKKQDMVEKRISDLRAQLKITDKQSTQWDAFAQTMRDNAQKTSDAFTQRAQKLSTMSADEAMKSYAALAQLHAENMQKLSSAMSDLYGTFSPDQKTTADSLFRYQTAKGPAAGKGKTHAPASASATATPASK